MCHNIQYSLLIQYSVLISISSVFRSEFDDSEAQVLEFNNRYDIVVHRRVNHSEIPPETVFGCVLRIPGTDYEIREESIYKHRHGRKCILRICFSI